MAKLKMTAEVRAAIVSRLTPEPEPCLKRCRSPVACRDWGYCRERNMDDRSAPTPEQIKDRRAIAAGRAALAQEDDHAGK